MEKIIKTYLPVATLHHPDGKIEPLWLIWKNGKKYEVKTLDSAPRPSLKAGGAGIRYKVEVLGKPRYIFLEETRFFVEEICKSAREKEKEYS